MVPRPQPPEADRQEQLHPVGDQMPDDPLDTIVTHVEAPEADVIEQALPADRELFEDDE